MRAATLFTVFEGEGERKTDLFLYKKAVRIPEDAFNLFRSRAGIEGNKKEKASSAKGKGIVKPQLHQGEKVRESRELEVKEESASLPSVQSGNIGEGRRAS